VPDRLAISTARAIARHAAGAHDVHGHELDAVGDAVAVRVDGELHARGAAVARLRSSETRLELEHVVELVDLDVHRARDLAEERRDVGADLDDVVR